MESKFNILDRINRKNTVGKEYEKYNNTGKDFELKTLHEVFEETAKKFQDNIAVIEGKNKITYKELDEKSNQVARYLIDIGVKDNQLIAVYVPRKYTTIINILGILKAGCAYVPIDTEYPGERVNYILENSKSNIILDENYFETNNIDKYSKEKVNISTNIDNLAYVIYTSGSTGVPKGVKISHRGACNTILDIIDKFNINSSDRIIALSSMCFDLSVFDIFGALSSGATLVQIKDQRDIGNIRKIMQEEHVTIWNSIPSTMQILVDNVKEEYENDTLRLVLLSGDWISLKLPGKIKKHFKNSVNISLGGATEASIWSIYYEIKDIDPSWKSIPYGMPLANQKMFILNKEGNLCPQGVLGEICIGGIGVAEGYVNNIEKTNAVFVEHEKLGRIYKTGDFGIFNKLGYIEFVGRKDNQVKIRGYRVELGEVESAINSYEGIKTGIVAVRKDNMGNSYYGL
ncbi:MAG: amino acid adenylation domain-containing protein [Clostridium sp.]|nr:amino acid adenylation domain-containing protein [Clostridium sp.]